MENPGAIAILQIQEKEQAFKAAIARLERAKAGLNPSDANVAIVLYGAVTTGEDWRFGVYHRANRQVTQDQKRYQVQKIYQCL